MKEYTIRYTLVTDCSKGNFQYINYVLGKKYKVIHYGTMDEVKSIIETMLEDVKKYPLLSSKGIKVTEGWD